MPFIIIRSELEVSLETVIQGALRALDNAGIKYSRVERVRTPRGILQGQIEVPAGKVKAAVAALSKAGIRADSR